MYLHIGKDYVINNKDIIGIFNLDYIKNTKEYKALYNNLLENKNIINITNNQCKTFILTQKDKITKGYFTNIGANTIGKRRM